MPWSHAEDIRCVRFAASAPFVLCCIASIYCEIRCHPETELSVLVDRIPKRIPERFVVVGDLVQEHMERRPRRHIRVVTPLAHRSQDVVHNNGRQEFLLAFAVATDPDQHDLLLVHEFRHAVTSHRRTHIRADQWALEQVLERSCRDQVSPDSRSKLVFHHRLSISLGSAPTTALRNPT